MRKYATCNILITPRLEVKPTRRRTAKVNMNVLTGMSTGPKPVKLVIEGKNIKRVVELMTVYSLSDAELAKVVHDSPLASEVKGKTDEQTAAWARKSILKELREMAEHNGDS